MKLTTSAQMRELDRMAIEERHIPSIDLMERAAEGVAEAVLGAAAGEAVPVPGSGAVRPGKQRRGRHCRRPAAVFERSAGALLSGGRL